MHYQTTTDRSETLRVARPKAVVSMPNEYAITLRTRSLFKQSCLIGTLIVVGCTLNTSPSPSVRTENSTIAPSSLPISAIVELGVVVQGKSSQINQWIQNRSNDEIHATTIEKSCGCLEVRLSKSRMAPGERVLGHFSYDGEKEPEFVGSLVIEVGFSDANGKKVGKTEVLVEVIKRKDIPNQ